MAAGLEFKVLGPLEVFSGAGRVELGGPKQRAVAAALLTDANHVVPLDRLLAQLWGDEPPPRATATLQACVSNLRRVLEPDRPPRTSAKVLVTQPPGYLLRVDPDLVDFLRFEALVAQGQALRADRRPRAARDAFAEALGLWRGPALADLLDEPFAQVVATRLEELRLATLEERIDADVALGEHVVVIPELDSLVKEHPYRERLWQLLMLALYRSGRQADALGALQQARSILSEDLGIDPGPALRDLEAEILQQSPALDWEPTTEAAEPARTVPESAAASDDIDLFVGRAYELGALQHHLQSAEAGWARVVLVEGEPGIGKTRLVEQVADEAARSGVAVLWGRCFEGEEPPPFWPWTQVLEAITTQAGPGIIEETLGARASDLGPLTHQVSQALGAGEPQLADPRQARVHLYRAFTDLLRSVGSVQPLLIVLDDLHWADVASLELLEFTAGSLTDTRTLMVATYREADLAVSDRLADTLGILARVPGTDRITLAGMSLAEVEEMVRAHTGTPPERRLTDAVHKRTNGNPFFVTELVRLLASEGRLGDADAHIAIRSAVPAGVRDVVRRRVARLPADAKAFLAAAAVTGRRFDLAFVAGVCGLKGDRRLEAAEAALIREIIIEHPGRVGTYAFSHALVRETLVEDLTPMRRARLHEQVANGLLNQPSQADVIEIEVARHLWEALPVGDPERALRYLVPAAEQAWAALAYEHAEELLGRASTLVRSLPPTPELADVDLRIHMQLGSVTSMVEGYAAPGVLEALQRAKRLAKELDNHAELVETLCGLSLAALGRGDPSAASELAVHALTEARLTQDPLDESYGRFFLGAAAFHGGRFSEAWDHYRHGLELWERNAKEMERKANRRQQAGSLLGLSFPRPDVLARSDAGWMASMTGDAAGARVQHQKAIAAAESSGQPFAIAFAHSMGARSAVVTRDIAATLQEADRTIEVCREHGFPWYLAVSRILRGWARAAQGEAESVLEPIQAALSDLDARGLRVYRPFHLGLHAEAIWRSGDADDALRLLDEAISDSEERGERFYVAELHRLKGLVLFDVDRERAAEARTSIRQALAIAKQQGARTFEQRAAESLEELARRSMTGPS